MARRWWSRAIQWIGFGLGAVLALLLLVLLLATQTRFGRERVRQVVVRLANEQLAGSLAIGALRFGPGCTLAIDSAVLRDPDGVVLAQVGPVSATCRFAALVRGQLSITSLDVARPYVALKQSSGGSWNWSRAVRADTALPVPDSIAPPGTSPARFSVYGPIRLHDGTVVLEVPGMPRRVLDGLTLNAPHVGVTLDSLTTTADIEEISARLSEPALTLRRLSGSLALVGDSAEIDLPFIGIGQSITGLRGWIQWRNPGTPAMSVHLAVDTLAFGDLAWLGPQVPPDGGGRFEASVSSGGGRAPIAIAVRSMNLAAMRSRIRGAFSIHIDSGHPPTVGDVEFEADPLHTDLLRRVVGSAFPPRMRGSIGARIVAQGNPGGRVRINTLDARYADESGAGGISRVTANGDVMLGNGTQTASLQVTVHTINARTLATLDSTLALHGVLRGTMNLDATPATVRISRADLSYAEKDSTIRLTGGGRIDFGRNVAVDLKLDAQPLAPSAFALSFPSLATLPSFAGPIEVRGSVNDLSLTAGLHNAGGAVAISARYRTNAEGVSISGTARVRDVDPRMFSGRAAAPAGRLDADVAVDLAGDSLPALTGKIEVSQLAGTASGITIEPSLVRFSVTESRVVADSVSVATSAGSIHVTGALARHRVGRDTMNVRATVLLEQLRPLLQSLAAGDSVTPDSVRTMLDSASGTIDVTARIAGHVDSLNVDARATSERLNVPPASAAKLQGTASLSGMPGAIRGRLFLQADSIAAEGAHFSAFSATAVKDDSTWLVRLATSPGDRPGGETRGSVSWRADTVAITIDSLQVRIPGSELFLARPARIRFDTSGTIIVDTVELRGSRGSSLQIAGVVRDTGAIAVALTVSNVPFHLAGTTGTDDSLRTRIDARAAIRGTAREPVVTLRSRVRLIDADSVLLDSIIGDFVHQRGTTRLQLMGHGEDRGLFHMNLAGPTTLSLSPFKAELPDDSISGEVAIDSLYLPNLTRIIPGIQASAGVLRMRLAVSGTTRHPHATGTTELRGGAALIRALGIKVHDANATVDISGKRLAITGNVAGGEKPVGRAEVSGFIGFGGDSTNLRVQSSWMPVMRLSDLADLDVTSDLRLVGAGNRPTLSGSITVDRGVLRMPETAHAGIVGVDDSAFTRLVDSLAPARASRAPPGSSALDKVDIGRITVAMGPNVWLRSSDANIQIGGSIGLERAPTTPEAAIAGLALRGALTTQRGNYRFSVGHISRLFELEQGSVTFTGESELNPRLDINAIYEREGYDPSQGSASSPRVRLHVGGTLEKPTLSFSSADAKLSQSELMSYLVTGQTHFALGDVNEGAVSSELVAGATDALAQRIAGGMFDVVNVTAGSTNTAGSDRGAVANVFATSRLGVGKQLSDRVFLKVDAGLCALAGGNGTNELWQSFGVSLDYRFKRGLLGSLSSAPSTNGANCSNQAGSRGTALAPRQWGFDFNRTWRF